MTYEDALVETAIIGALSLVVSMPFFSEGIKKIAWPLVVVGCFFLTPPIAYIWLRAVMG